MTWPDVQAAASRIEGVANRTPVATSRTLDALAAARAFLKCESFQRAGAFKFRGAYNALSRLDPSARSRGVLTYSSGNHAQALALAGRLLGAPVTVVMPRDAPEVKRAATEGYGAEIVLYDRAENSRERLGRELAEQRGLAVIPPYDHPDVIAGQGTVAKELLEEVPDLDLLIVPCGGGGLLSGCAIAAKALRPGIRVVGVEPEAANDATLSFRTGVLHTIENPQTIADGARTPSLGEHTFPIVRELVDDMSTVDDRALVRATFFLWERMKLVVEPTGALAVAALMEGAVGAAGLRVGVVVSGGNVDLRQIGSLFDPA